MSLALHYWMGGAHHCSGPPVSEMTYTVSSGTLNLYLMARQTGLIAQRFFIFGYFLSFYFGSCGRLSWLNCQLSNARCDHHVTPCLRRWIFMRMKMAVLRRAFTRAFCCSLQLATCDIYCILHGGAARPTCKTIRRYVGCQRVCGPFVQY